MTDVTAEMEGGGGGAGGGEGGGGGAAAQGRGGRGKGKGKGKVKGQTFVLVHRSRRDAAYAEDNDGGVGGQPSDMVLVPKTRSRNETRRQQQQPEQPEQPEQPDTSTVVAEAQTSGEGAPDAGAPSASSVFEEAVRRGRRDVDAMGLPVDGYDYAQHLAHGGGGVFVGADGSVRERRVGEGTSVARPAGASVLPEEVMPSEGELPRVLEHITLSEQVLDDDMRAALFGDAVVDNPGRRGGGVGSDETDAVAVSIDAAGRVQGGEQGMGDLQDDFVMLASQEVLPEAELGGEQGGETGGAEGKGGDGAANAGASDFDWDAHIARLLAESEACTRGGAGAQQARVAPRGWENDDMSKYRVLQRKGSRDEETNDASATSASGSGSALASSARANRGDMDAEEAALDAQLERALEEYDSDQIGDLEDDAEDDAIHGMLDDENQHVQHALDEFVRDMESEQGQIGARRKARAHNGQDALPEGEISEGELLDESDPALVRHALRQENPYLRERERAEWDCETILSTYSNLDNRPSRIGMPRSQKSIMRERTQRLREQQLQQQEQLQQDGAQEPPGERILLSKLGIPLGVLSDAGRPASAGDSEDADEADRVAEEEAAAASGETQRRKGETKEEKKARKARVKAEKRMRREQKKQTRQEFRREDVQAGRQIANQDATAVASVFRYNS